MKKMLKKVSSLLLVLAMVLTMFPLHVQAEQGETMVPYKLKTSISVMYKGKNSISDAWIAQTNGKKLIKKFKSSDPSVAETRVTFNEEANLEVFCVVAKKPGKANVTFTYNKKKYTVKVVVEKYKNPFKSIKIGKTKVSASIFNKDNIKEVKYSLVKNKKLPVSIQMNKGWEISYISYVNSKGKEISYVKGNCVSKFNKTMKFNIKKNTDFYINVINSKKNISTDFHIIFR